MDGAWLFSYVALWGVVAILAVLLLGLAREVGTIQVRFGTPGAMLTEDGLQIGAVAPDFVATEVPSGNRVSFSATNGRSSVLIFLAPDCGPCKDVLPRIEAGWADWRRMATVHVLCAGEEPEVRALIDELGLKIPLVADPATAIRATYDHPPSPYAFLIDEQGIVRLKGVVNHRDDIDRLLEGQARIPGGRPVLVPDPTLAARLAVSPSNQDKSIALDAGST